MRYEKTYLAQDPSNQRQNIIYRVGIKVFKNSELRSTTCTADTRSLRHFPPFITPLITFQKQNPDKAHSFSPEEEKARRKNTAIIK